MDQENKTQEQTSNKLFDKFIHLFLCLILGYAVYHLTIVILK